MKLDAAIQGSFVAPFNTGFATLLVIHKKSQVLTSNHKNPQKSTKLVDFCGFL